MGIYNGYQCSICNAIFQPDENIYVCPHDGGNLDVLLDVNEIRKSDSKQRILNSTEASIWRYLPLLPIGEPGGQGTPLRVVGWTPVFTTKRLQAELEIERLWIKDESRNPTASFKDRASAVVVARAREIGAEFVVTASTGNAGAALAGMAAAVGQKAIIFAPRTAPQAKIAQLLVYGARVILVNGSYDQAFDLSVKASEEYGWYCRNTGYNPFTAEGKKTAAFEIWEQVLISKKELKKNLCVFVSVGDGNIISGLHKGFKDLKALGWLATMPRIFGVQSKGSAAISNAFIAGTEDIEPVHSETLADSISVDLPRDGVRALRAARETGGAYILVTDNEILGAIRGLGKSGIFAEPAGAAAYAGVVNARKEGIIGSDDPVLALVTGSGLKDIRSAMQAVAKAPIIEPNLKALKKIIQ
ncbi:MAG TPA: threonine synthase [Anaerolineae bacterium]|nr:threonine synthase [Anaerolineae bacterium]